MIEVLTFILAGGRGERLDPLTRDRTKPAVPFGGIYRIIDFTLSNCINSGLRRIYVLTQYKSFSLQKHLLAGWDVCSNQLGEFIDVIPAQQRISADWYKGTADAIYQNIYAIQDCDPELILILSGDHVYKMDYRELIRTHREQQADVTVCCVACPKEDSTQFGVIEVDKKNYALGFQEKPEVPKTIPKRPNEICASMGIYLFNREALLKELDQDAQDPESENDFGKNVIPQMIKNKRKVYVYDFVDKQGRPKYWRDIGTRDAYYQANMDLLTGEPEFNLFDRSWPMRTYHEQYPPVKMVTTQSGAGALIESMAAGGCVIRGGAVEHSILSPNVRIHDGAQVKNSVLMEGVVVGENARIQNAIIDKEVIIPPGAEIGYDLDADRRHFVLTASGVVIVPKKSSVLK
jgi:glucose-1-phosphate adenylyltransferase